MARLPRLAVGGHLHLISQSGHGGQPVFRDAVDRSCYLSALRDAAKECHVAIHAYVLLDDEVQLLLTPTEAADLTRVMQKTARRYVGGFNSRHACRGSVWGGRFRSAVVEAESFLLPCMAAIEQAPVRRHLVASPDEWKWSSAAHHLGRRVDPLLSAHPCLWRLGNTPFEREARYKEILERALTLRNIESLSAALANGWALGSDSFIEEVEQATGRRARPAPRGRPKATPNKCPH